MIKKGHESQWLLPGGGMAYVPLTRPAPGITILVHGVNDIGEAYPFQEKGICDGLNERLFRGSNLQPANYELPPVLDKNIEGDKFTAADVNPDPDKVYFARSGESTTSPVIPFYWGFREVTELAVTNKTHGEYLDQYGNRIDKRFAKNGGPFVNATTNIPDMFGKGFDRNFIVRKVDPKGPTHPLLSAPPRTYMVLAAQRLASLIRIIRKKSPNEPINIVAHSQGCFITTLAHAILAKEGNGIKADTIIVNNWPYSVDEPGMEKFQSHDEQQTTAAREETLVNIIKNFITANPATEPKFASLNDGGDGVAGQKWGADKNKERDNRGKFYMYFSPDDQTVGMGNVEGIGFWGLNGDMLNKLGDRFYQRVFASPKGPTKDAPEVGSPPHEVTLRFVWNMKDLITVPRKRMINAEELPHPFFPYLGTARIFNNPIDAAIATANPYNVKGKEGMLRGDKEPADANARWMGETEDNSYHSSIVSNPMHNEKATAYDLSVGVSSILKDDDLKWIRFLRAIADWRTNWQGKISPSNKKDFSYPSPTDDLVKLLHNESEIDSAERKIIFGNYNYYCDEKKSGELPEFTNACTVISLAPHVKSETIGYREERRKQYSGA